MHESRLITQLFWKQKGSQPAKCVNFFLVAFSCYRSCFI